MQKNKDEKYGVGKVFPTNEGYEVEILKKTSKDYRTIKFIDFDYTRNFKISNIREGNIKNPFHKSVCGVGYLGVGKYSSKTNKKCYQTWIDMIKRVHNEKELLKRPAYRNVKVCEEWYNFQNFAEWYEENYPKNIENIKFSLDKDLLQENIGNKIYSPKTCVFLPININCFFNNVKTKNTTGYIGVSEVYNKNGIFVAQINDFETKKRKSIKYCKTKEEAFEFYKEYRIKNVDKVKDYLRSLNYLSEEIIELVR